MSIFKRGKVYWYNFFWNGKHVQRSTRQGNPKVARQIEAAYRTQLAKGEVGLADPEPVPTLGDFAANEFKPWARATFRDKPKTLAYYTNGLNRLEEFNPLWSAKLDEVSGDLVSQYVVKRQEPSTTANGRRRRAVCVTSINRELQVLRRVLHLAVEWGRVDKAIRVRMLPGERKRDRVLTPGEQVAYLNAAAEPLRSFASILAGTGMRPEEAFRLDWAHVTGRRILITHGKTAAARRSVPMRAPVFWVLARLWVKAGKPDRGWVFPAETRSGHAEPSTMKKLHRKAIVASGVPAFVLYAFRHTFLTRLGESGCDAWTLARIAGHATLAISVRYVHPGDQAVANALNRLGA